MSKMGVWAKAALVSVRKNLIRKEYLWIVLLPVILFYEEMVLRISVVSERSAGHVFLILLFSFAYGWLANALTMLIRKDLIYHIVQSLLIFALAIPYCVVYFVFCKFNILYDLGTVFAGAGDVVTDGFLGDIGELLASPKGILHLVLFLLPFVLYLVLLRRFDDSNHVGREGHITSFVSPVLIYLICLLVIRLNSLTWKVYDKEYTYSGAVADFGVATAWRLDLKEDWFGGGKKVSFDTEGADFDYEAYMASLQQTTEDSDSSDSETTEVETEETEIDYGYNVLEIDFDALAADADDTLAALDSYVAGLTPSSKNAYTGMFEGKNLIFITAEAFSAEVIDENLTPTLYRMANQGIQFTDYYQFSSAGTTGGEYSNLFGMLPTDGGESFKDTANNLNYMTMGYQLDLLGYYGQAFHNNSYTFYSRNITHNNLGYSAGFMGYGNGMEEYVEEHWPQSDDEMIMGTYENIYKSEIPFNIYYMSVSGHSNYEYSSNAMARRNWEAVENLEYSELVKGYLACQIELDKAMEHLIEALEEDGIADDTVIVIAADHFPYGLDDDGALGELPYLSELYGYNVETVFQRDHNRLIIWSGCLEDEDPIVVDTPTYSCDILPTLLNLFGVDYDSRLLPGRDVFSDAMPLVFDMSYNWKTELGTYYASTGEFVPADDSVTVSDDYISYIQGIVRNKMTYERGVLANDYWSHVFGSTLE